MADTNGQRAAMQKAMRSTPGAAPNSAMGTIARTGMDKIFADVPTAFGMKSQTRPGGVHPTLHGQAINDEVDDKLHMTGRNVQTAYGMGRPDRKDGDRLRDTHEPDLGSAVLKQGMTLGNVKR